MTVKSLRAEVAKFGPRRDFVGSLLDVKVFFVHNILFVEIFWKLWK